MELLYRSRIYSVFAGYGTLDWDNVRPLCRGPVAHTFVLDTKTKKRSKMPPLPAPRYAAATQLWRGRLHVMGGSKENRHPPGVERWSLAVKDCKPLENEWRTEIPIPRGGPHRPVLSLMISFLSSEVKRVILWRNPVPLYLTAYEGMRKLEPVLQKGSKVLEAGLSIHVVYGDVYMLDKEMKWTALHPVPKPNSHIEFSWVTANNSIIIAGGTTEKHPVTKRMILVGEVFQFHLDSMKWSVIGKLPYQIKTTPLLGSGMDGCILRRGSETEAPTIPGQRRWSETCGGPN